jgi:hypothetical protein
MLPTTYTAVAHWHRSIIFVPNPPSPSRCQGNQSVCDRVGLARELSGLLSSAVWQRAKSVRPQSVPVIVSCWMLMWFSFVLVRWVLFRMLTASRVTPTATRRHQQEQQGPEEGIDHLFLLPERVLGMDSAQLRQDLAGLDFSVHVLHTAPQGNVWLCKLGSSSLRGMPVQGRPNVATSVCQAVVPLHVLHNVAMCAYGN